MRKMTKKSRYRLYEKRPCSKFGLFASPWHFRQQGHMWHIPTHYIIIQSNIGIRARASPFYILKKGVNPILQKRGGGRSRKRLDFLPFARSAHHKIFCKFHNSRLLFKRRNMYYWTVTTYMYCTSLFPFSTMGWKFGPLLLKKKFRHLIRKRHRPVL